ncbi:GNAT family N-acetyltransferase [Paenibacillus daejeonensis]|uniref:GNAT family N-acetyltransferase n=1 Tax=Paenibacillus daejeonensis TaxID=135193 RepID=UPI0003620885|nr:GNAT family N-acetyltransferase [Paenibacillus daejeonensis]
MELEYKINSDCSSEELSEVFEKSGIRRPSDDLERLRRMIENADEIVTARDSGKLIGVLRAITDYSYCCYISDLAVDKEYQAIGIGRELINVLINKLGNDEVKYILTSAPQAEGFYEKIGFDRDSRTFVIKRLKN